MYMPGYWEYGKQVIVSYFDIEDIIPHLQRNIWIYEKITDG